MKTMNETATTPWIAAYIHARDAHERDPSGFELSVQELDHLVDALAELVAALALSRASSRDDTSGSVAADAPQN